ncbi:substrate-binding periplasmic protein [Pseudomonas sp. UBA1879]|uniref:substrate-binding periplasmic protein n=1 Tax=Pseudomonas sp. UBA1879 TaxID=1947305 RepID=UPI0025F49108|nr:transporter substrate-binding domain-containing protein [Pseudomonas sp. UBA1879]
MCTIRHSIKRSARLLSATVLTVVCLNAWADTMQVVTEDSSYSWLQDGKVTGPASEIVEKTLNDAGLKDYHMALYPWARAYDMARLEPNVVIYPMIRNVEREALFHWVGELEPVTQLFYRLRTRPDVLVGALQDARNYTVGVVRDDARQQYLESQHFSKIVVSANNLDNLRKLLSGQVALVPMPEREAREQCRDLNVPFDLLESVYTINDLSQSLYLALSLKTPPDTVKRVTEAFARLKADGTVAKALAQ